MKSAARACCALLLLIALPLLARETPTLSSVSPGSVHVESGEWFVTLQGSHFLPTTGVTVVYTGPAGTLSVAPSVSTDSTIVAWVPSAVLINAGTYSVKVRAIEGRSIYDSNSVSFKVVGTILMLNLPTMLKLEAASLQGTIGQFDVSGSSQFGDPTYVSCSHRSGELFPLMTTTVDCSATDDFGNSVKDSFDIVVADTTAPVLDVHDLTVFGTKEGAAVRYDMKVSDAVDPEAKADCAPSSGSLFPVGISTVNCSTADRYGNSSKVSFRITVGSDDMPALTVPVAVAAEAQTLEGATVKYDVTAVDVKGNASDVRCDPPSGSFFPMGATTVKCTAWGPSGQSISQIFNVTVGDHAGPVLSLPRDFSVQASGPDGEYVKFPATATDAVDGDSAVACSPASATLFPSGQTTVSCSSTDKAGNTSQGSFVVTVNPWVDDTIYSTGGSSQQ
jgi:hypothetical protein